jgi:pimeloyl-ACP methyl ester carboxylesterase
MDMLKVVDALVDKSIPLYGIGHSIGASSMLYGELQRPGTFTTILAIDPVCNNTPLDDPLYAAGLEVLAGPSKKRRYRWPSRQAAHDAFIKRTFFQTWEKHVLDAYVEHGLVESEEGVQLKCVPAQEYATFAGNDLSYLLYQRLPELGVSVVWMWGDESTYNDREMAMSSAARCKATWHPLEGVGHLVPMEVPFVVTRAILNLPVLLKGCKL